MPDAEVLVEDNMHHVNFHHLHISYQGKGELYGGPPSREVRYDAFTSREHSVWEQVIDNTLSTLMPSYRATFFDDFMNPIYRGLQAMIYLDGVLKEFIVG